MIAAMLPACAWAQKPPIETPTPPQTNTTPTTIGPSAKQPILGDLAIGERAPDFWLDASNGDRVKLSSLRGHWIVLVFNDALRRWRISTR
jgi:hypothetical protein